jgi:hypothetical protein
VIRFNSIAVDNGLAVCGRLRRGETVDNINRHPQGCPHGKQRVPFDFSGFSTASTGPSATTLFFFNSSNN